MTIDPNQPQVAAAIVGGSVAAVVSLVVAVINQLSLRSMHRQKLDFDREQAERRTTAEIALAEKKLALDQGLASWKWRSDLAEQALTNFYEARTAIRRARTRLVLPREGEKRPAKQDESDALKALRDAYYTPVARLDSVSHVFSELSTLRPAFQAYFGRTAIGPFDAISGTRGEIIAAAGNLIENANDEGIEKGSTNERDAPLLDTIGWGPGGTRPDEIDKRIDEAVRAMEALCHPVLGWRPSA